MTVNLTKGQGVNLDKPGLRRLRMALGWDPAQAGRPIDLDASVLLFDGTRHLDTVYYGSLCAVGVEHGGDNLTGAGDGDDEVIDVDLGVVRADSLVFTVNSFTRQRFTEVANAFCRLVDLDSDEELVRFELSPLATLSPEEKAERDSTGLIMAALQNVDGRWEMSAVGQFHNGRTGKDMVRPVAELLAGT